MANYANLGMFVPGNCKMGGDLQQGWPALIRGVRQANYSDVMYVFVNNT